MSTNQPPGWSNDDGDWDPDKTVVIPNPGGRLRQDTTQTTPAGPSEPAWSEAPMARPVPSIAQPIPPRPTPPRQMARQPEPPPRYRGDPETTPIPAGGINPLVAAATPLLGLLSAVREANALGDPMELRARIEQQLRGFSRDTMQTGASKETLDNASYCLATALDEAVLRTPWGAASDWRKLSLLQQLHGDAWGGEKFFKILKAAEEAPASNLDLLELLYICLALGFEGQYAIFDDGARKLATTTEELYTLIRRTRGPVEHELSPNWQNEAAARVALEHSVPVWVVAAVAGAVLLAAYLGFLFFLKESSRPVMEAFLPIGKEALVLNEPTPPPVIKPALLPVVAPPPPPPPPVNAAEPLRGFLQREIDEGLVEVDENATQVTVRLVGSAMFASGSDQLTPAYKNTVVRIGEGVVAHRDRVGGDITVVGHTDNVPLRRSIRFQDNYDLSLARARTVARLLREQPTLAGAVTEDGRGDSEPLGGGDPTAANRTPEQRAANRRVEILVDK